MTGVTVPQQLLDRDGEQVGSARSRSSWSGCSNSVSVPVVMRLRVVSLPAFCSSMKNAGDLHVREPVAVDLGFEQHAHQVVAWCAAALGAHGVGVRVHRTSPRSALLGRHRGVEPEGELGPLEHLLALLLGNADEIGDHLERQPERDVGHEVALTAVGNRIDDGVDPRLHVTRQVVDATRREPAADDLAELGVLGRVEADQEERRTLVVVFTEPPGVRKERMGAFWNVFQSRDTCCTSAWRTTAQ